MKIAYLIEGMFNSGGMERVLSVCANTLCNKIDVSIVTLYQKNRSYYFHLDKEVTVYDLAIEDISNKKEIKIKLENFFHSHKFDIVISLGGIDMYYLHSINDGSKKILWFHFAIDIAKTTWIGKNPNLAKRIKAQIQTWRRIFHARFYKKIIVISLADLNKWKKYTRNATLIYNPITIEDPIVSNLKSKSVISVGRLDFQKGFDYLINAWNYVNIKHPDWSLYIYGEGPLRDALQKQIDELYLTNSILLCGRVTNIVEKYKQNSIYVMSSRAEGFGLVLLEASSCGLPLVSFNCPSGPSEIIEDGKNGFLINKVGDIQQLANKINLLIENSELRNYMGKNAKKNVRLFSIQNISYKWIDLFHNI